MSTETHYWLVKSEPYKYSFAQLLTDKRAVWDGVRNYEARNNLRAMKKGDLLLFYHSNEGKAVVGIARVAREAYPDPTAEGEDWSAIDVEPVIALKAPVELEVIKSDPSLTDIALLKRSRLSVVPVSAPHFEHVLALGKTKLPVERRALRSSKPSPAPAKKTRRT
ncbi:EVE domain-containing protein [Polyangium sp. y55x31]|uniref:EVE domain-containing protein n=1 Tax=Polyangium sp. y55x31 TaxID=3042688 RepID=UPI0024824848|nr:EVE domain-containing protein [Polyangium sp. y55x31]MDI1474989.1 EVE domain-containing protein [Polyangium sp. y55x31]